MNGVLFESGSAKYLKLMGETTQFHSSWENATVVALEDWEANKYQILDLNNVDWYARTIKFVPIVDGKLNWKDI